MNFMNNPIQTTVYFFAPLVLGMVVQTIPLVGWGLEFLPGDLGDTRFNLYVLENGYQFITGQTTGFWNAGFMHPEAEVISLSDNLIGAMPFYAFFRSLGCDLFTAFQWWVITLTLLNYLSSFLFLNYVTKSHSAAGLGAFVFTFSIGLAAQMNHAQLFPRFAIPLMLFLLLLWMKQFKPHLFFMAVSLLVYQFFCGIYLGFLAFIPFFALVIYAIITRHQAFLQSWKKITNVLMYLLAVVIHIGLLLKLFQPYLRRAEYAELHRYDSILHSIPTPLSYFSAFPGNPVHGALEHTTFHYSGYWDHWIFPGWLAWVGFLVIVYQLLLRKAHLTIEQKALAFTGLCVFLLYLRIGEFSLYQWIQAIPGFASMRSITRIINVQLLFFGVGVSVLFLTILRNYSGAPRLVYAGFLLLLLCDNYLPADQSLRMSKAMVVERHEQMLEFLNEIPVGSVVSVEPENYDGKMKYFHLDVMLATQALGLKCVNGYSGMAPYYFDRYWEHPNAFNRNFYFQRFEPEEIGEVIVLEWPS